MAKNSNGDYMTKVKMKNGVPTATVWVQKKKAKTGTYYYGGTYTSSKGKKVYISFIPTSKTYKDRNGNDVEMIGVTLTFLPEVQDANVGF